MQQLKTLILGTEPLANQLAFIYFTLLGMFLVKLWRYYLLKKRLKNQAPAKQLRFNLWYWLNDNFLDFLCALFTSILVHRFLKDVLVAVAKWLPIVPKFNDNMFYGVLLGLSFQYLAHKIMNKLKIVDNG